MPMEAEAVRVGVAIEPYPNRMLFVLVLSTTKNEVVDNVLVVSQKTFDQRTIRLGAE